MLNLLLNEIRAGGTLETNALAVRLGSSPQLLQAMLEHLERSGQIRPYSSCLDGCQGCSLQTDCHTENIGSQLRLWQSMDVPGIAQVQ